MLPACGTYSAIRPADTLEQFQVELSTGLGVNQLGEGVPLARVTFGATDHLELAAHFETYSGLVSARYGILNSKNHSIALSFGIEGGSHIFIRGFDFDVPEQIENNLVGATVSLGRGWAWGDLYLSHKSFLTGLGQDRQFYFSTNRLGARVNIGAHFVLGVESGFTVHHDYGIVEATGFLGVKI